MMSKTVRLSIAVIVSAGFFMSLDPDAAAFREKRDGVDLLVVPVKYSPLQVAFDTIAKRDLVLVGYKRDSNNAEVVLHVWNGLEWIEISEEQFESSAYLRAAPERIVLIGDDSSLPPMLVEAAKAKGRGEGEVGGHRSELSPLPLCACAGRSEWRAQRKVLATKGERLRESALPRGSRRGRRGIFAAGGTTGQRSHGRRQLFRPAVSRRPPSDSHNLPGSNKDACGGRARTFR